MSFREQCGNPIIFQWIEKLKDIVSKILPNQNSLSNYVSSETSVQANPTTKSKALDVTHGPTIVDRKSVFQGHACVVKNEKDVK